MRHSFGVVSKVGVAVVNVTVILVRQRSNGLSCVGIVVRTRLCGCHQQYVNDAGVVVGLFYTDVESAIGQRSLMAE